MLPEGRDLPTIEGPRIEIGIAEDELRSEIANLRQELAGLRADMQKYLRTIVISQVTAIVGVAGIVFGIVHLA